MKLFHIALHAKLFSINRTVEANSYSEAALSVAEYMPHAKSVWIEDITGVVYED